jgi:hypothetical protein
VRCYQHAVHVELDNVRASDDFVLIKTPRRQRWKRDIGIGGRTTGNCSARYIKAILEATLMALDW